MKILKSKTWHILYENDHRSIELVESQSGHRMLYLSEGGWAFKFTPQEMDSLCKWWKEVNGSASEKRPSNRGLGYYFKGYKKMIIKKSESYSIEQGEFKISLDVSYKDGAMIQSVDITPKGGSNFSFLNSKIETIYGIANLFDEVKKFLKEISEENQSGTPVEPLSQDLRKLEVES